MAKYTQTGKSQSLLDLDEPIQRSKEKIYQVEEILNPTGECLGGTYTYISSEEELINVCKDIKEKDWVGVDIETQGLSPFQGIIFLISFAVNSKHSYVFDPRHVDPSSFIQVLKRGNIIAHNAGFEYIWFRKHYGVRMNTAFDTMIAKQLLICGLFGRKASLEVCAKEDLGIIVDKKEQTGFAELEADSPLTNSQIAYSAGDAIILINLKDIYTKMLKDEELYKVWMHFEKPIINILAEHKFQGIPVNVEYIKELERSILDKLEVKANEVLKEFGRLPFRLNIQSPKQLLDALQLRGIDVADTNEEELKIYKDKDPIINMLLDYRGLQKELVYTEAWGNKFLNPVTNRVHPDILQAFTDTGRFSSRDPNAQNIPKDARFRRMIVGPKGHKVVTADYSQFEVRILAQASGDEKMKEVIIQGYEATKKLKEELKRLKIKLPSVEEDEQLYNEILTKYPHLKELVDTSNNGDFHRMTASLLFHVKPEEVTKKQRTLAKAVTFAIPYGGSSTTIAQSTGLPEEEGAAILSAYYRTYKGVRKYLYNCREHGVTKEFTMSLGGRKRYYDVPKQGVGEDIDYKKQLNAIKRASTNQPIQSTNADSIKYATHLLDKELQKISRYDGECRMILWVHDEIVVTAPPDLVDKAALLTEKCMIKAANVLIPDIPIEVSVNIADTWVK